MNYIGIALEVAVDISHILIELLAVNGELIGSEYLKSSRLEGVDSFFKLCFGALCGNALRISCLWRISFWSGSARNTASSWR